MPFKSDKQRRYLYAEKPKVAKKFAMDSAKKGKMVKLKKGDHVDTGDFGSEAANDASLSSGNKSVGYGGGDGDPRTGGGVTTGSTKTKTTTTPERKFYKPTNIPTIGPASWALNKVINTLGPKAYDINKKKRDKFAKKEGLYRDFYRMNKTPLEVMDPKNKDFLKDAGYGPFNKEEPKRDGNGQPKCADGSLPPCAPVASKPKVKVEPVVKKTQIFDNFKAYKKGKMIKKNKGGGVPYGPPPLRGPNPQVPPVKFSRGGGAALRGLKFTGVK